MLVFVLNPIAPGLGQKFAINKVAGRYLSAEDLFEFVRRNFAREILGLLSRVVELWVYKLR